MILLSSTTPNWSGYIKYIQDLLGNSPTRCLDKYSLDLRNPYSLPVSLQNLKTPDFNPWQDVIEDEILQHIYLTILIDTRHEISEDIYSSNTYLKISHITLDRVSCLMIMTGTLLDWRNALFSLLCKHQSNDIRKIFAEIYNSFKQTDFRNLWKDYKLDDNILVKR